jgi:hypothetical protein
MDRKGGRHEQSSVSDREVAGGEPPPYGAVSQSAGEPADFGKQLLAEAAQGEKGESRRCDEWGRFRLHVQKGPFRMPDVQRHEKSEGGLIAARGVSRSENIPGIISQITRK